MEKTRKLGREPRSIRIPLPEGLDSKAAPRVKKRKLSLGAEVGSPVPHEYQLDKWKREEMEATVRRKLELEFGVALPERRIAVVDGVEHRFDLASEDGSIIGEVKTSGENVTAFQPTRLRAIWGDFSRDCMLLLAREGAKKRVLALTNEVIYHEFRKSQQGKAAEALGIDIRHVQA